MRKIEMRITEDEYEALKTLETVLRFMNLSSREASKAADTVHLILLNAKPDGEIV
jgi:hypothetical protein